MRNVVSEKHKAQRRPTASTTTTTHHGRNIFFMCMMWVRKITQLIFATGIVKTAYTKAQRWRRQTGWEERWGSFRFCATVFCRRIAICNSLFQCVVFDFYFIAVNVFKISWVMVLVFGFVSFGLCSFPSFIRLLLLLTRPFLFGINPDDLLIVSNSLCCVLRRSSARAFGEWDERPTRPNGRKEQTSEWLSLWKWNIVNKTDFQSSVSKRSKSKRGSLFDSLFSIYFPSVEDARRQVAKNGKERIATERGKIMKKQKKNEGKVVKTQLTVWFEKLNFCRRLKMIIISKIFSLC